MRKLLSAILAMLMILSTVSFAAPAMVGSVADVTENVTEVAEPVADVTAQEEIATLNADSEHGTLVYEVNFDNLPSTLTKTGETLDKYLATSNVPSTFPATSTLKFTFTGGNDNSSIANGVVTVVPNGGYSRLSIEDEKYSFPTGEYYLEFEATCVTLSAEAAAENGTKPRLSVVMKCSNGSEDKDYAVYDSKRFSENGKTIKYGNKLVYDGQTLAYGSKKDIAKSVKCLQFMFDNGKNTTFKVDNVKVYYKPYVTVSFDAGSVSEETAQSVKMIAGNFDFSNAPVFKRVGDYQHIGWALSENGAAVKGTSLEVESDTVLYAVWQDMTDDRYGDLLYSMNFEKTGSFDGNDLITNHGFVNTMYAGSEYWTVENTSNQSQKPQLVSVNGNSYIQITNGTSTYPMFVTRANNPANSAIVFAPNGVYTMVQDIQHTVTSEGAVSTKPSFRWQNCYADVTQSLSSVKGQTSTAGTTSYDKYADKWYTVTASQKVVAHPDGASYNNDGVYMTQAIYYRTDSSSPSGSTNFLADNMKLYYKPFNAKVTFLGADGNEIKTVEWDTSVALNAVNVANVIGNVNGKLITGVSTTVNGNYSEDIIIAKDTAVYLKLSDDKTNHEEYGKLLFMMDFDNISKKAAAYYVKNGYTMVKEGTTLEGSVLTNPDVNDFNVKKIIVDPQSCSSYNGSNDQHFVIDEEANGNKYGSVYGKNSYMIAMFRDDTGAGIYKKGTYTVSYKVSATLPITIVKNWYEASYLATPNAEKYSKSSKQGDVSMKPNLDEDTWHNVTYAVTEADIAKLNTADITHLDVSGLAIGINTSKSGATLKFDDIKVYWKPTTVNVTIDMNGNTDKTVGVYANDTNTKLSLAALKEHVGLATENHVLVGFSKTADGTLLTEDFWVSEDATLYAVWGEKTPATVNEVSMRTDKYTGVRFKASVTKSQKEAAAEYGFIIALKNTLGDKVLTHDCGVKFVEGKNYIKAENKDVIYDTVGDNVFFTAVLYNLPETKDAYTTLLVARPFTKDSYGYSYGSAVVTSLCDIAKQVRDSNYAELTEDAIENVKAVLAVCGESTEPQNN